MYTDVYLILKISRKLQCKVLFILNLKKQGDKYFEQWSTSPTTIIVPKILCHHETSV